MNHKTINTEQGHWILAKMGKRVLRPGGKELTRKLLNELQINSEDEVVEFAPGIGFTASLILKKNPKSYLGIELNEEAADRLEKRFSSKNVRIINTTAAETGLKSGSADKVLGEAMLTMQADHRKSEIIKEAYRVLKPGGVYAIHELGLIPDELETEVKAGIQRKLAQVIKVNARPLTKQEWCDLLEKEGFKIKSVSSLPMHLLEPSRMISDEGFFRTLRIGFNVLTHPKAKKQLLKMRQIFRTYEKQMTAFAIVAEK